MKKLILYALVIIIGGWVMFSVPALAAEACPSMPANVMPLTSAQQEGISQIRDAYAPKFKALEKDLRNLDLLIDRELDKDHPRVSRLNEYQVQRDEVIQNLQKTSDTMQAELLSLLTGLQIEFYGRDAFTYQSMFGGVLDCGALDDCLE